QGGESQLDRGVRQAIEEREFEDVMPSRSLGDGRYLSISLGSTLRIGAKCAEFSYEYAKTLKRSPPRRNTEYDSRCPSLSPSQPCPRRQRSDDRRGRRGHATLGIGRA